MDAFSHKYMVGEKVNWLHRDATDPDKFVVHAPNCQITNLIGQVIHGYPLYKIKDTIGNYHQVAESHLQLVCDVQQEVKGCVCAIASLMNQGCKCGQMTRERVSK